MAIALLVLVNTSLQPYASLALKANVEVIQDSDGDDEHKGEQMITSMDVVNPSPQTHHVDKLSTEAIVFTVNFSDYSCADYAAPYCESTKRYFKKLFNRIISRNAP